ncbi:hypothetical protein [Corynebacterium sp. HMSC29G08]|uniref:hypothetical protein n=1 Tax=Corynebacterium sp. HMSC29G08 TaxID=1581069 RepID=UPI0008A110B2|nr:hypothetical protein [Corynebacterium sp. HMSC29G08]OFT84720.1 hypothetical protein HMPREF3101_03960 [Corynebacterium sp. HMSC29G08]
MTKHQAARPLGCRSCCIDRTGKRPKAAFEWESLEHYSEAEYANALEGYPLPVLQRAYASFTDKLNRATSGELSFGDGHRFDVTHIRATQDILELKWANNPPQAKGRTMLWLRIYFTEPARAPRLLLKIRMQLKGVDDKNVQTQIALDAQRDFDAWIESQQSGK